MRHGVLLVVLITGCTDQNSSSAAETFTQQASNDICNAWNDCVPSPDGGYPGECMETRINPVRSYDSELAGRCLSDLPGALKDCSASAQTARTVLEECSQAIGLPVAGAQPTGASCNRADECATGLCWFGDTFKGVCMDGDVWKMLSAGYGGYPGPLF
jgi:hypothetical protein